MKTILPVLSFLLAACSHLPSAQPTAKLAERALGQEVVAVVKVKSPWYAPRALITSKFRDAVPEHQAAVGLIRKQFSFAENGDFGGVYLWRDKTAAETWFGPEWHARVKKQRGVDGDVRLISVQRGLDSPISAPAFEGPMVVTIGKDALERYGTAPGLRAAYEGEGLVIATWDDRRSAQIFLGETAPFEWFDTPVGIVNH
jgi:hypothetical protein